MLLVTSAVKTKTAMHNDSGSKCKYLGYDHHALILNKQGIINNLETSRPPHVQEAGKRAMMPLLKLATYPPWNSTSDAIFEAIFLLILFRPHLYYNILNKLCMHAFSPGSSSSSIEL